MRIAVIGAGAIGRTHIDAIAQTDGVVLSAIADPFDAGARLAAQANAAHYGDHRALVDADPPDAAIIATPNELHVPQALDFIEAGIPVLVEKPVAGSLDEARTLVAASQAHGVPVLVGHHRRYHPVTVRAKEIVDSGALGRIVAVGATYFLAKPDDYFETPWHRTPGTGGAFLINLIHEIDMLRHLVGEVSTVSAMSSNAVRGLEVEDTGAVSFAFANGALGSIVISDAVAGPWSWDLTAGDSPRFPVHGVESHRIGGTEASLTVPNLDVWRHDGSPDWTTQMRPVREQVASSSPYHAQLRHFADVVAGRTEPLVGAREGAQNLAVLEAIVTAAHTGTAVEITPV